uniref:fimbrial protein n=1 Tax=unclassified Enterobacter TaxID=2608935 RepID=UPI00292BC236
IGPDPRNFNQRVSLGRNDLLIRTFPNTNDSSVLATEYFELGGTNIINQLACSVSTSSLSFPIGNVPSEQFIAVGTVSQQISTQNLGLNCDAGAAIKVTMTGIQSPDSSDPSILALSTGENTATGVGVQLLYGGKPLQLNQMLNLKNSAGGQETFPITARYIQTKDKVTAGSANATATLNITYQ